MKCKHFIICGQEVDEKTPRARERGLCLDCLMSEQIRQLNLKDLSAWRTAAQLAAAGSKKNR